jgi:site-specific DNA-methyltransferase (adenine-specific)
VWDIPQDRANVHPTAKPVELMRRLMLTYSDPGALILDNTMGAGATGIAAVLAGRRFLGIELDAGYFATTCQRIRDALLQKTEQARQGELFSPTQAAVQEPLFAAG